MVQPLPSNSWHIGRLKNISKKKYPNEKGTARSTKQQKTTKKSLLEESLREEVVRAVEEKKKHPQEKEALRIAKVNINIK